MTPTLLICNRGEIAVRIARTAKEMGIRTVAVYSDADAGAMHVSVCDRAVRIGPPEPKASYLNVSALSAAAGATGATMVHPGYGFLSENADFAEAVIAAGLVWVGPSPNAMRALGGKLSARAVATDLGIPVLPGAKLWLDGGLGGPPSPSDLGFPLLVKASAGGGGRGMRRVDTPGELDDAIAAARAEAVAAFGDGAVYVERLLTAPRHVEVQVFGDGKGGVVILGERDCSIQRRHQKLIEEAPFTQLGRFREELHSRAQRLAASVNYASAGTVEFLWDGEQAWFLEMNTRLQVEHPVTELVFGLDIVRAQLELVLAGSMPTVPEPTGHAIECRIVAEDPAQGYLPAPGRLTRVRWPCGPGVRVDAGVREGDEVSSHYDALLAKIIVHAPTREAARQRMIRALDETEILGVPTTAERLGDVLRSPGFTSGEFSTGTLETIPARPLDPAWVLAAAALDQAVDTGTQRTTVSATPWQSLGSWP